MTLQDRGNFQGGVGLSDAARTQAIDAATAYLTDCVEKATTLETTCGFSSYQFGDSYEKVRWF